ncbi:MAG: ABC transporter permease subunit [Oscillospiraceae bacterium]|nr:ABC transporter permease subunit [Oscillospiraceae bacterium]
MKAIFKRELRSYFLTLTGYVFFTMFLLLGGFLIYNMNITNGYTSVNNTIKNFINWETFILPILTMRMFAEDRKLKTDQLLLTSPVPVRSIVIAKFFAAFVMVFAALVVVFLCTASFRFFGRINWAEMISSYIGFLLLCGVVLAIGEFMSSLTDSMIVAAFSTYAVLIVTVFLGSRAGVVSGKASEILLWLSPTERFNDFAMGILDPAALVYYISIIVLFIAITIQTTERRRFS